MTLVAQKSASVETASAASRPKAALMWVNLGPYHIARAAAAASVCELTVIELAAVEKEAGWSQRGSSALRVETLSEVPWERQSGVAATFRLLCALHRLRPSVLFIAGYRLLPFLIAGVWGRLHGCVNVLLSDSTTGDRPRHPAAEFFKARLLRLYHRAIVAGTRAEDYLAALGFDRDRIGRPYDVVDTRSFAFEAESLRRNSSHAEYGLPGRYFLFVGRLILQKNVSLLLRAFAAYREQGGGWDLAVIGEGSLREQIAAECARLGTSACVHLAGRRTGTALAACYAFAGCFVLPSASETWGLVVNEAMACGLPVLVSSRCGCADDLVREGENGFVFDPADEAGLTGLMLRVCCMTAAEVQSMSTASSRIAAAFSLDAWAAAVARSASPDNTGRSSD